MTGIMSPCVVVSSSAGYIRFMAETVFSHERLIEQPKFQIPEALTIDKAQTMNGMMMLMMLPDDSIPLVMFDPQYRSVMEKQKYGNEGKRQKARALLPQMSDLLIGEFLAEIERILMPSGHLMLWVDKYILLENCLDTGPLKRVDMIVWNKMKIGMGYRTRRCSEYLLVLQKKPVRAKGVWKLHNIPDNWSEKADKFHPHSKPVGLIERLIEAVTNDGDMVVDPAAGGYNVLRAAMATNRHFLGCDIQDYYMFAPIDKAGYIHFGIKPVKNSA